VTDTQGPEDERESSRRRSLQDEEADRAYEAIFKAINRDNRLFRSLFSQPTFQSYAAQMNERFMAVMRPGMDDISRRFYAQLQQSFVNSALDVHRLIRTSLNDDTTRALWNVVRLARLNIGIPTVDVLNVIGNAVETGELDSEVLDAVDEHLAEADPKLGAAIDEAAETLHRSFPDIPRHMSQRMIVGFVFVTTTLMVVVVIFDHPLIWAILEALGVSIPVAKAIGKAFDKVFPESSDGEDSSAAA
jgi:hypothetical protein